METGERFESWAVVEIMGHQTYAGFVSEQTVGGCAFVRVDVPEHLDSEDRPQPAFSKLFSQGAIYCITPCSEEIARCAMARHNSKALNLYMPELYPPRESRRALEPAPETDTVFNDDYDTDDHEFSGE